MQKAACQKHRDGEKCSKMHVMPMLKPTYVFIIVSENGPPANQKCSVLYTYIYTHLSIKVSRTNRPSLSPPRTKYNNSERE